MLINAMQLKNGVWRLPTAEADDFETEIEGREQRKGNIYRQS
jgi:hypothetical protein